MSSGCLRSMRGRQVRRGRRAVARMARSAPRQYALERLVWQDRVAEVLAEAEPADLVLACLLVEGLSLEETAGRLGISQKAVYGRLERWRRRIGEGQPELAAWLGEGRWRGRVWRGA
jgi:DNA-directed RNA polymerase specialized sigma24 family protein